MRTALAIALGGAIGATARHVLDEAARSLFGTALPYGILAANVLGSFAIGFLYVLLIERLALSPPWRGFFLVGLLGGFTTFSTFALDTVQLAGGGSPGAAAANVVMNVSVGLLAVFFGYRVGQRVGLRRPGG